ncbi:ATP-binding protein [Nonomuraea sediminis]|uniref:ATP-binding protein n=1 Tax=Nonomuraea sediminis TaxID=2835864 RepID=UPI001BDD4430|nr:ATP-binding protein [Nonomuraea sediminis]
MSMPEQTLEERLRQRRFAGYPSHHLALLALIPLWDDELAEVAGLAPMPDSELVESTTVLREDGSEERVFWIRESVRPELGAYLRAMVPEVLRMAVETAEALSGLIPKLRHSLLALEDDPSGLRLLFEVERLVEGGAVPEAARLVATAKAVAEVVGGYRVGSARRAEWRLARAAREAEDAHYLRHYQPREEIEAAVNGADSWAVHLLGPGGSGKTMLIRHLGLRTARVDFDHLDPRYPENRPGEMFLALAVDLLGWVGDRLSDRRYTRFLDAVNDLHEELDATTRVEARVGELREEMVRAFATFLRFIPEDVVLVLDTCEELAKLYPLGEPAPGIDVTFELLELLHEQLPSLKVLLAGRRWLVPPASGDAPAGPRLRPRPYLRVIQVGGFSPAEAERYLAAREVRDADVVLARARSGDEYNPFDLAAYADWLLAEPDLDARELLSAPGDPYVRQRIIGRIKDPAVARCLGVAAELGTIDRSLVGEVFGELGVEAEAVLAELAAQEWARVRAYTADGRPALVELEPNLCERLRAETATDPGRFPVHETVLGSAAAHAIDAAPSVAEVTTGTVLPAVRFLAEREAVALWQRVEDRVVAEGAWGWAEQVAARAAAACSGTVLAAVLSTQAACRIHTGAGGVAPLWRHVERIGSPGQRDRALLGRVAAGDIEGIDFPAELRRIVSHGTAPAASIVAAVDGWMADGSTAPWAELRAVTALTDDPATRSFALDQAAALALMADAEFTALDLAEEARLIALDVVGYPVAADHPPAGDAWARVELVRRLAIGDRQEERPRMSEAGSPEADRLRALELLSWKASRQLLDSFARVDRYLPGPVTSWAARQVKPFVVALAEAYVSIGEHARAAELLRERLEEALTAGDDPDTVEACQLGLLMVCRRARSLDHYPAVRELARTGSPVCRSEAWITLTLVTGQRPEDNIETGSVYAAWRCGLNLWPGYMIEDEDGIPPAWTRQARLEHEVDQGLAPSSRLEPPLPFAATRFRWLRGLRTLEYAEVLALHLPGRAAELLHQAAEDLGVKTELGRQAIRLANAAEVGDQQMHELPPPDAEPRPTYPDLPQESPGQLSGWKPPQQRVPGWIIVAGWTIGSAVAAVALLVAMFFAFPPIWGRGDVDMLPIYAFYLGPPIAVLAIGTGVAVWRSNLLARGMTAAVHPDGAVSLTRHTYARWGGPAWRRFGFGISPPRPRAAGSKVSRLAHAVLIHADVDLHTAPVEHRVLGHLPDLPAVFRSMHSAARLEADNGYDYQGPDHVPRFQGVKLRGRRTHLIGTPVDTRDGIRLRVMIDVEPTVVSARRERLRAPEGLARLYVLQAEPVDGPPRPFDEKERDGFLAFARALCRAGTPAVLITPPLPDQAASKAVEICATWRIARQEVVDGRRMLKLQRRLREIVAEAGGDVRAMCDVILFLPTESKEAR